MRERERTKESNGDKSARRQKRDGSDDGKRGEAEGNRTKGVESRPAGRLAGLCIARITRAIVRRRSRTRRRPPSSSCPRRVDRAGPLPPCPLPSPPRSRAFYSAARPGIARLCHNYHRGIGHAQGRGESGEKDWQCTAVVENSRARYARDPIKCLLSRFEAMRKRERGKRGKRPLSHASSFSSYRRSLRVDIAARRIPDRNQRDSRLCVLRSLRYYATI